MVAVERGVAHMMELVFEDITFFERLDLQNGMEGVDILMQMRTTCRLGAVFYF